MTSSAREALKWIALVLMTGDHVAKVFFGGYVPVLSELGRIAFPVFALVMAYNLAQPRADYAKSVLRLAGWGLLAQPFHAWVFGYWLPLNVLLTFSLAAAVVVLLGRVIGIESSNKSQRRPFLLLLLGFLAPLVVDYQWSGVWLVVTAWGWFRTRRGGWLLLAAGSMAALCWYNANVWALAALPVLALGYVWWPVPRLRWAFYGYYVGHLFVIALIASLLA
ncbi:conjugal transfer protein [Xanthomonas phaseoli pv. phaseoli]|uniref:TraX family protein n=1 Tax=Xanthomonas phaseoli TaxID=1985254 RepID=UPI0005745396|nr:TraX family protein [Xanthomonas phaseoli]KHS05611.1 conjugal transfer protein [Xanthomonas phaseoli pv. phaseoli]